MPLLDALACACSLCTKEERRTLHGLAPTWRPWSSWSPSRRHHQSLWQARTNFSQDKCTRCSPSKWPIVGALPAQYLGRGPGPLPINRTSHPQGRGIWILTKKPVDRATELLLAVCRTSQEQTLARLFLLVLFIISPRGNPPHHTLE